MISYLQFYRKAKNKYEIHSPIVYNLMCTLYSEDKKRFPDFLALKAIRKSDLSNRQAIKINDLGAGSLINRKEITIAQIAQTSSSSLKKAKQLAKIVAYFGSKQLIELGTSLGYTSAYIKYLNRQTRVITIEGDLNIYNHALHTFQSLSLENINAINSSFDDFFIHNKQLIKETDLLYIDGNHTFKATLKYFEQYFALRKGKQSIIIMDDIYWNSEMTKAWQFICEHYEKTLIIDNYQFGIVMTEAKILKNQKYNIIPFAYKPWQIGLKV